MDERQVIERDIERLLRAGREHEADHGCKGARCQLRGFIYKSVQSLTLYEIDVLEKPGRFALCRHCKQTLFYSKQLSMWIHDGAYGPDTVNCHASSYWPGKGFDDTLDASWQAAPETRTIQMQPHPLDSPAGLTKLSAGRVRLRANPETR